MTQCFKELADSPKESWGPEGFRATRRILVPWANRNAMALELRGTGYEFTANNAAEYPGSEFVKCVRVASEPWVPKPNKQGAFNDIATELQTHQTDALLTVEYELVPTSQLDFPGESGDPPELPNVDGTFLTYSMDFGGEFMTVPKQNLQWLNDANAPVPEDVKASIRIPIIEHRLSWSRVSKPPWGAIRALTGKVNGGEFIGLNAEQLLFEGARATKEFITLDELQTPEFDWKLDYIFRQRTVHGLGGDNVQQGGVGWNHNYRTLGGVPAWDKLLPGGDVNKTMYETGDFTLLFAQAKA